MWPRRSSLYPVYPVAEAIGCCASQRVGHTGEPTPCNHPVIPYGYLINSDFPSGQCQFLQQTQCVCGLMNPVHRLSPVGILRCIEIASDLTVDLLFSRTHAA